MFETTTNNINNTSAGRLYLLYVVDVRLWCAAGAGGYQWPIAWQYACVQYHYVQWSAATALLYKNILQFSG